MRITASSINAVVPVPGHTCVLNFMTSISSSVDKLINIKNTSIYAVTQAMNPQGVQFSVNSVNLTEFSLGLTIRPDMNKK